MRDLAIGGAPRLYIDILARLGGDGIRTGIVSSGGDLEREAQAAGIRLHTVDWERPRDESYAAVAAAARDYDAAVVIADPELVHVVPALLGGAGRAMVAVHSHMPSFAEWFGPPGLPGLREIAQALIALPSGGVLVRGRSHAEAIAALLDVPEDHLVSIEHGIAVDQIAFEPREPGDRSIMVLTRLAPETLSRVEAAVELTVAAHAAGRPLTLRVVGDGPSTEQALELCRARLPDGTWRHEPATRDPVGVMREADWVVATGLTALLAAAAGCVVTSARRAGDGRGVLGPPLTPELYDIVADDLLASSLPPWTADDVWDELRLMNHERLRDVRARVEERSSGLRQQRELADALAGLHPTADPEAVLRVGAIAALRDQERRDTAAVADRLWKARDWYEEQIALLRS